ncbi:hypothetical protein HY449_02585 [Candidatus Pacearchaeota archaeon]|nr:hypothetical protein [Candidatus Pacearchaeota archaeon]
MIPLYRTDEDYSKVARILTKFLPGGTRSEEGTKETEQLWMIGDLKEHQRLISRGVYNARTIDFECRREIVDYNSFTTPDGLVFWLLKRPELNIELRGSLIDQRNVDHIGRGMDGRLSFELHRHHPESTILNNLRLKYGVLCTHHTAFTNNDFPSGLYSIKTLSTIQDILPVVKSTRMYKELTSDLILEELTQDIRSSIRIKRRLINQFKETISERLGKVK